MRVLSPVVWREGMHLAQHHFQLQSRYIEDSTAFAVSSLFFRPTGLVAIELDREALVNGTVVLTHGRGVMPDGLPFDFPADAPPEPLHIRDLFSPTRDGHVVCLTIPSYRGGRANCALDGSEEARRYAIRTERLVDETTGIDEKSVDLAQKNFALALDTESDEERVSLPIARVVRDGSGMFTYDPDFVPPTMQIGGSGRLMAILGRLIQVLEAKSESLRAEQDGQGSGADYARSEVAGFWLLHAVNSALGPLRHLYEARSEHPDRLYLEMARLAGALCTFSMDAHPRDVPRYDHEDLTTTFRELDRLLRRGLDVVLPTSALRIPLGPMTAGPDGAGIAEADRAIAMSTLTGEIKDRRAFAGSTWFLGVRSSATPAQVAAKVPGLVKICSAKHIVRLVREAYSGLSLEHLPSPPVELSPRVGTQYFRLGRDLPCWKSIVDTERMGVYVPAALPEVDLELIVVVEE